LPIRGRHDPRDESVEPLIGTVALAWNLNRPHKNGSGTIALRREVQSPGLLLTIDDLRVVNPHDILSTYTDAFCSVAHDSDPIVVVPEIRRFLLNCVLNPFVHVLVTADVAANTRQLDPTIRPMERVLGVQLNGVKKAYPFSRLKKQPSDFEDDIAGQKITIHFDRKSENAYTMTSSGSQVPSMVAFWFAWVDFYADTLVFRGSAIHSK
jgi:hypothetical protein